MERRSFAGGTQVKDYVQRQWTKILAGRVSLADFVFAKEVRLGTYSARHGIVPPAAIVAGKAMASDPRMEPRYGERVPYVVVYGEPGVPHMPQGGLPTSILVQPHIVVHGEPGGASHAARRLSSHEPCPALVAPSLFSDHLCHRNESHELVAAPLHSCPKLACFISDKAVRAEISTATLTYLFHFQQNFRIKRAEIRIPQRYHTGTPVCNIMTS